jgi:dihydrofolate reductase
MPRIRYSVAMSLDGYIAGPDGEFDWIMSDPASDFSAQFAQCDTFLLGRRTFEITRIPGSPRFPVAQRDLCFLARCRMSSLGYQSCAKLRRRPSQRSDRRQHATFGSLAVVGYSDLCSTKVSWTRSK